MLLVNFTSITNYIRKDTKKRENELAANHHRKYLETTDLCKNCLISGTELEALDDFVTVHGTEIEA